MFKEGDKVVPNGFEFDFGNNFYALELTDGRTYITICGGDDSYIMGLNSEDRCSFIDKNYIKKIIAIIQKR